MTERIIAIGDIHGCKTALETLLEAVAPGENDVVVALGDFVDRGPDAKGVIDLLIEWGRRTRLVGLLGNHEEMMLEVIAGNQSYHEWVRHGAVETLDSYGFDGNLDFLPQSHAAFFDTLGDYFEYGDFFFTHAAYDPELALADQPVELLRWYSLTNGLPSRHLNGKTAVVGHTANRDGEVLDVGHLVCLDTYCYGGGWLTAMEMNTRQFWQASENGVLRR